jgi:hypothetical protein
MVTHFLLSGVMNLTVAVNGTLRWGTVLQSTAIPFLCSIFWAGSNGWFRVTGNLIIQRRMLKARTIRFLIK